MAGCSTPRPQQDRRHSDPGYRERWRAQREDEHRDEGDRHEADAQHRAPRCLDRGDCGAQRAVIHGAYDDRGDRRGRQCGQRHVAEEGAAGEVQVAENDEIGQVGARQEK